MKTIQFPRAGLTASCIAYGCMQIGGTWDSTPLTAEARAAGLRAVHAALDEGIDFFDHADIYCRGKSEKVFAGLWRESPHLRQSLILQSKCGIRFRGDPNPESPVRYDFSAGHILESVENILRRLETDWLDILLLHRPDPLIEPEEVARAFDELHQSGKVRHFGVSNFTAAQIEYLQRALDQPLVTNQVELNLLHNMLINAGVVFNQVNPPDEMRTEGTLDYCRMHGITLQAWSPLARGLLSRPPDPDADARVKSGALEVARVAEQKGVLPEAILIAWLLRHPAGIQPVIGTTNPARIQAACQGAGVELDREEWYRLFTAGRGAPVP